MSLPATTNVRAGIGYGPTDGSLFAKGLGGTFATQNYGKQYTFSGWVLIIVAGGIVSRIWSSPTGGRFILTINNNTLVHDSGGSSVSEAYAWPVNTWVHFAITRLNTAVNFYINGIQQGTTKTLANNYDCSGISTVSTNAPNALKGCLDEFAAWSRILTDSEIADIYNAGAGWYISGNFASTGTPVSTNLLHLYHMDEGSGSVADDSGSLAADITITAAEWVAGKVINSVPPLVGTLDLPAVADVRAATQFDGLSKTGLLDLPAVADVKDGVWFDNHTKEGELVSTLPAVGDVRAGVPVGGDVGTLELPAEAEVLDGVGFGTDATEFVGSLDPVLPTKEITGEITSFVIEGEVVMEA